MASKSDRLIRTIRLDEASVEALLDRIDASGGRVPDDRRAFERYKYRLNTCVIHIRQPGDGGSRAFLAPTRNLSAGGISFLHGGFVHPGSTCMVQLISQHGTWENVKGVIVGAHLIEGTVHEISVCFERSVDPVMYCSEAQKVRVLLAEDDPALVKLCSKFLDRLHATVDVAPNGQVAVEKASQNAYDVILMDMEMPVMTGFEAAEKLRSNGYSGRIVATTAMTEPRDREKCIEAGCDTHIAKPYTLDDFMGLFETLREEPLFSSMAHDPSMSELIYEFVQGIPRKLQAVEEAYTESNLKELELAAQMLKGEAGGFGFDPITEAAAKLEKVVRSESEIELIKQHVDELAKLCGLARAPKPMDNTD